MRYYFVYLLFFVSGVINAQNFFTKTFHVFGDDETYEKVIVGSKIFQLGSGDYILACTVKEESNRIIIIKVDSTGNIIWERTYKTKILGEQITTPVFVTSEGITIVCYITGEILEPKEIHLAKLDKNGGVLWDKLVDDAASRSACDIFISADNEIYLTTVKYAANSYSGGLLKFSEDGTILYSKEYDQFFWLPGNGIKFTWISSNRLLLSSNSNILFLNDAGDVLWEYESQEKITSIYGDENGILVCKEDASGVSGVIKRIDLAGALVDQHSYPGIISSINPAEQNNYVIICNSESGNVISVTNDDFNIIHEWNSWGTLEYAEEKTNCGFLTVGELHNSIWFLKTDTSLDFSGAEILSPSSFEEISPLFISDIKYLFKNVSHVSIELSTDNGISWELLETNVPASGNYKWFASVDMQSDSCLIRLTDNSKNSDAAVSGIFRIKYNGTSSDFISTNNIKMWISNNGMSSCDPNNWGSGFFWPKDDSDTYPAIYTDGIVYGCKVNNQVRVGGSTYRYGLKAGPILSGGSAADHTDIKYKIHKIRKNWESMTDGFEKKLFEYDYNNWPGDLGAPFIDTDNDGKFTSGLDHPDYIGDEQLYYVSNDLNAELTTFLYGSPPIGLEIQQTLFGFDRTDELADVVFKKVMFINKSQDALEDMYVSYFTDDLLGNAMDNFVGCDTTLSLGYTYNSDNEDEEYYGSNPPSIGHQLLQGPIVSGAATDSALFKGIWKKGYKNLPMTGFVFYVNNSYIYKDPSLGVYNGSVEMYNNMQSLSHEGAPFVDPIENSETKFCLSGDPVSGIGWYEGKGWPSGGVPGERRYLMSSGPFTMAPGDTQEVVYAILMARGSNNINSIAKLKSLAGGLKEFLNTGTFTDVKNNQSNVPVSFELFQNYPNPFNPTTTINYQIPKNDHVTVKVYDILGREVATLVNRFQKVGKYNVELNASNLASGVYLYSIQTTDFRDTKKMILMK